MARLAQGLGDIKGTDTIHFIRRDQVPKGRVATYGRIVVDYRPHKEEKHRTRLTVGGDRIAYPWDVSTPTANLQTIKLLWNSVIASPGNKFCTMDIKKFYLNTPLDGYEYMRLRLDIIPDDIIDHYGLRDKVTADGWVYIEIRKGMYGLPQSGILANKLLERRLNDAKYF